MDIKSIFRDFNYPEIVFEIVFKFRNLVLDVLGKKSTGILLVGSASRGELCWADIDGRLIIFSDIEFMVVVEKIRKWQKIELSNRIIALSDSYEIGGRFHLDFSVCDWGSLAGLPRKIFVFDAKSSGLELTSYKVRDKLPEVSKFNLDFKELNDILLHRLKSLLRDIPDDIFDNKNNNREFVMSIVKNALDVTTWLYPYESNELISGYGNRLKAWDENSSELMLSRYLDESDFSFLRACLNLRRNPSLEVDQRKLTRSFIALYENAIQYCKAVNNIELDEDLSKISISANLFDEFRLRRRLIEAYKIFSAIRLFSPSNVISSVFLPRKGIQTIYCFEMLKAMEEIESNENLAVSSMSRAAGYLKCLRKVSFEDGEDLQSEWKKLRTEYAALNEIFI